MLLDSPNDNPQDSTLEVSNITPEWVAGMFDGNGIQSLNMPATHSGTMLLTSRMLSCGLSLKLLNLHADKVCALDCAWLILRVLLGYAVFL